MFDFSIVENTVSLLPGDELIATEMFKATEEGVHRIEFYQYNTWVVAYMGCSNGIWGKLHMDENFMNLYWDEEACQRILQHAGVFDKNKITTFRR